MTYVTYVTYVTCFLALSPPLSPPFSHAPLLRQVRWRRAVRLSNKLKLRRWVRICKRFYYLYEHMHIYRNYRLMHRTVWAWLSMIETNLVRYIRYIRYIRYRPGSQ